MTDDEVKKLILETLQGEIQSQVEVLSQGFLRDGTGHETTGSEEHGQQDGPGRAHWNIGPVEAQP